MDGLTRKRCSILLQLQQSTPGAIAVNGAIVVGYKLEGIIGVIAAIAGTIIPPFVIISVISFFYELFASNVYVQQVLTGMQAGVGAVIACVVFDMGSGIVRSKSILIYVHYDCSICSRLCI